jgi:toxin ParE1/3/4
MARYSFTKQAENDLDSIMDFSLQKWGVNQSLVYLDGLEELAQNLANFPDLGTDRTRLLKGLLSFPYLSHVLFYTKQPHGITVVRVLHKRMEPKRHLL